MDYPTALTIGQSNGDERTCGILYDGDYQYADIEFASGEIVLGVEVCFDSATSHTVAGSFKISTNMAVYGPYGVESCSGDIYVMRGFQLNGIQAETGDAIDRLRFYFDRCIE